MPTQTDMPLLTETLTFWNHLTQPQQNYFLSHTSTVSYPKGSSIQTELTCAGLLLVKSGVLRVYMLSAEGREITLYRIGSGEVCVLSASCALKTITFDVVIEAVKDCEMIQVDSVCFSELMQQNVYLEAFSYRLATERFSDVMWTMQQILFMSFDKRLAVFLLDEAAKTGTDRLKMTHEEIAKYMGSAREVVSRMLKYFTTEGLVTLSRGEIRLTDRKKLRELI